MSEISERKIVSLKEMVSNLVSIVSDQIEKSFIALKKIETRSCVKRLLKKMII